MENKRKSIILSKALYGQVRLEHHPDKGFIVAIRSKKVIFWFTWAMFKRVFEKFDDVVKVKGNLNERKKK